jgi:SAM-dependent methyltransferase
MADACRGCAAVAVRPFLDLGVLPLAGGFLRGPEDIAAEQRYPLLISVCDNCGLVQIVDPVDPEILFGDYSFATGTVPGLVRHFDDYSEWIKECYDPAAVIEFGANDGTLVAALGRHGVRAVGIDMAPNVTAMARERGLDVISGAFSTETVPELLVKTGPVDLVTGSNVFAHNAQPGALLEAADAALAPNGVLCLEVMYAADLLDQLQWDTLYHEHLTFYSLGTLQALLTRFGFEAIDAVRIPMHGGSLRLSAARSGARRPSERVAELQAHEDRTALNQSSTWDCFADACGRRIGAFGDTMRRLSHAGTIWAYGAAGKATMWVNACQMDYLEAVVDASPLRAGKLMPGTHTPIVSPAEFKVAAPDYVFASAWNYLDAIRGSEPQYSGYWIVPLPEMRVY